MGRAPLHQVPIEGRLGVQQCQARGVHNPLHRREQPGVSRPVQGPDGSQPASLSKTIELPAGSCTAAACAAGAFATAPATMSLKVSPYAGRQALACAGPFPSRRGIVLRALQCAVSGAV